MSKGQAQMDEFGFVLLAGVILIFILMISFLTPTESPPFVEPTSINLIATSGSVRTFDVKIFGPITNVTLKSVGEIRNWVSFDKNRFNVVEDTFVTVTIKVPSTVSLGSHSGTIELSSTGGEQAVLVTVNVQSRGEALQSRSFSLGDFTVQTAVGSQVLDTKENFEVFRGYFSEQSFNLIGIVDRSLIDKITDARLEIVLEDTNSAGNLIIKANNKEVFNKKASPGKLEIPIDPSSISESNIVKIEAGLPGWMFWVTTVYKIRSAKLIIGFEGIVSQEFSFDLREKETRNFDHLGLSFRIKDYSPGLQPLLITINNQIAFLARPPLAFFDKNFTTDILGKPLTLNTGENTISFAFEEPSEIEIANTQLTVLFLG